MMYFKIALVSWDDFQFYGSYQTESFKKISKGMYRRPGLEKIQIRTLLCYDFTVRFSQKSLYSKTDLMPMI